MDFSTPRTASQTFEFGKEMVRSGGLEPPLRLKNSDLNAARLPIPPRPQIMPDGGHIDEAPRDAKTKSLHARATAIVVCIQHGAGHALASFRAPCDLGRHPRRPGGGHR